MDTERTEHTESTEKTLSEIVIGAALEVHRTLGPGLLESTYEECLTHELALRGLQIERQCFVALDYKSIHIHNAFRLDFWVERKLIIELKAVEQFLPLHEAQLLTYLRLTGCKTGLLINFNSKLLKNGIRRLSL
ncbi:GxxExxY protein [Chitiniphilus shinanonensis]|uniref:GxxExxY protein n=1 Tax=Chitiniphilus shinanonensis TaxID=553088 RepID=UPI0030481992